MSSPNYVYVMERDAGGHKIGFTRALGSRRLGVAKDQGSAVKLRFCLLRPSGDARTIESLTHKALASSRADGEWFNVGLNEAVSAIESAASAVDGRPEVAFGQKINEDAQPRPERLDVYPSVELRLALDRWRIEQPDTPSRAEAVRRVLDEFLRNKGVIKRSGSTKATTKLAREPKVSS